MLLLSLFQLLQDTLSTTVVSGVLAAMLFFPSAYCWKITCILGTIKNVLFFFSPWLIFSYWFPYADVSEAQFWLKRFLSGRTRHSHRGSGSVFWLPNKLLKQFCSHTPFCTLCARCWPICWPRNEDLPQDGLNNCGTECVKSAVVWAIYRSFFGLWSGVFSNYRHKKGNTVSFHLILYHQHICRLSNLLQLYGKEVKIKIFQYVVVLLTVWFKLSFLHLRTRNFKNLMTYETLIFVYKRYKGEFKSENYIKLFFFTILSSGNRPIFWWKLLSLKATELGAIFHWLPSRFISCE